ncbi:MAG: hypothetical protein HQK52_01520 [Oligoflexia bacterium]|nr:hypothetical protein [Oligoflexia bacterium]
MLSLLKKVKKQILFTPFIYGKILPESDIFILTWVTSCENCLSVIKKQSDPYWGNLIGDLIQKGKKPQLILQLLFSPSKKELDLLLEHQCLVLNPHGFISLRSLLLSICYSFTTLSKAIFNFKRIDTFFYFLASFINYRTILSLSTYRHCKNSFKNIIEGKKILIPWEGQPEQRAICLAAQESGANIFGYIHSSLTNNPLFAGRYIAGNSNFKKAFPKHLFIHGRDHQEILAQIGHTPQETLLIQSARYHTKRTKNDLEGKLFLPYGLQSAQEILLLAKELILSNALQCSSIVLHPVFRNHPLLKKIVESIPLNRNATEIIVGGFSTIIFEALESGYSVYQLVHHADQLVTTQVYPSVQTKKITDHLYHISGQPHSSGAFILYDWPKTILDHLNKS